MAEAAAVPSPSLVLHSLDSTPGKASTSRTPNKKTPKAAPAQRPTKRKQTKSRNGCVTCKAKRLKCDETKVACMQCARRGVTCGGYKKDFKWRPFEEPNISTKSQAKPQKGSDMHVSPSKPTSYHDQPAAQHQYHDYANPRQAIYFPPPPSPFPFMHVPPVQTSFTQPAFSSDQLYAVPQSSPFIMTPQSVSPVDSFAPGSTGSQSVFGSASAQERHAKQTAPSSVGSGRSPLLRDLLIPGTDLSVPPEEYSSFLSQHEAFYQPTGLTPPARVDDDVAEIARSSNVELDCWSLILPSPVDSHSSGSSADSPDFKILSQPHFSLTSSETLTRRYDRDTCGVLSVKDGPTENPWRTLIWPLARDCPALYHAIASMTSFHQSKELPAMRVQGIHHMHTALNALLAGLKNMRSDAAISTTLVLAFAESWDQHIRTGYNHIKGAKVMITDALLEHRKIPKRGDEWARLKFLCKTWIYMDVIARLTSADDDESDDLDAIHDSIYATDETVTALDPLMGCAHTLFPIIGRVANLVRKVRRSNDNGPSVISQAIQLKSQLEDWTPPSFIEDPEDETTSPHDSIKTAVAYRFATLLYLHQAVPQIPSPSSSVLAKKVLCELATVEPRSRSIIVHIFPLMAAGCEAIDEEDRAWVIERWGVMAARMKLGIIDRGIEVTKEVWSRRDAYEMERKAVALMRIDSYSPDAPLKRDFDTFFDDVDAEGDYDWLTSTPKRRVVDSFVDNTTASPNACVFEPGTNIQSSSGNTETLEQEFTVKGRLHWLGVMKDWEWEVLLG